MPKDKNYLDKPCTSSMKNGQLFCLFARLILILYVASNGNYKS